MNRNLKGSYPATAKCVNFAIFSKTQNSGGYKLPMGSIDYVHTLFKRLDIVYYIGIFEDGL